MSNAPEMSRIVPHLQRCSCILALLVIAGCITNAGKTGKTATPSTQHSIATRATEVPVEPSDVAAVEREQTAKQKFHELVSILAQVLPPEYDKWVNTRFATQAESELGLFNISPNGRRFEKLYQEALDAVGLTRKQVASLTKSEPALVDMELERFKNILRRLGQQVSQKMIRDQHLPRGNTGALDAKMRARGVERQAAANKERSKLFENWLRVATLEELTKHVRAAALAGKSVFIHISADWCGPCREWEKTFADPTVSDRLAAYQRFIIDVTNDSDDDDRIREALNARNLPSEMFYLDAQALATSLEAARAGETRTSPATPTLFITRFLDAKAFLARLPAK